MGNELDERLGSCCEIQLQGPETPDIWPEMAKATLVSLARTLRVRAGVQLAAAGSGFAILLLIIVASQAKINIWRRQILARDAAISRSWAIAQRA